MNGYLGIDVSKGYADFTLLNSSKKQLEEVFQLDDTRSGHDSLKKQLLSMMKTHGLEQVYCGLESTGGFENNWYQSLNQWSDTMSIDVVRLNPSVVKSNAAATLQRNITDALSSRYIAEFLIAQGDSVDYRPASALYSSFRSFNNHINLQKRQQVQLVNQLKAILYSSFPELLRFCKNNVPMWLLGILKKYPSVAHVRKVKAEQLSKIKHVDKEKAISIINKAKTSIASRTNPTDVYLIKQLAEEIERKQQIIKEQKELLAKHCTGAEITLLTSITGIAKYSAAVIMTEIENITRFTSSKKIVSYYGVHPELKDSGDKKGIYRMSKRGRASMRGALYMCAQSAVLYDSNFKKIYHRHRSRGFNHKQAIGVIMQKMLRIIWAVLSKNTPYNPAVDEINQMKNPLPSIHHKAAEQKSKRRYQQVDVEAPITRKQTKIRKVYSESQVSDAEQMRDHQNTPV